MGSSPTQDEVFSIFRKFRLFQEQHLRSAKLFLLSDLPYVKNITFISNRCPHNTAAATPVKIGMRFSPWDIVRKSDMSLTEKSTKLQVPNPGPVHKPNTHSHNWWHGNAIAPTSQDQLGHVLVRGLFIRTRRWCCKILGFNIILYAIRKANI